MAISTNSIIHYTSSFEVLSLIIKEGFKIKYCGEKLLLGRGHYSAAAHPMVSFCDIPLSESKQHFDAYGRYGIGLSKKWAIHNGVNPVLYIDENSLLAESIYALMKARRKEDGNLTLEQKSYILKIKSYAKNYSGTLIRNGNVINDYKFYDEREWRLVPKGDSMNEASFSIKLNAYEQDKDKYNSRLSDCRIKFEAEDISYIIVDKLSEIPNLIKVLRETFSERCTVNGLDILLSKICSTEQIVNDY